MPDGPDEIAIDELEGGGISLDTDFEETDVSSEESVESLDDSDQTRPYWYYFVIMCLIIWILFSLYEYNIIAYLATRAWPVFPVAIYFDSQYVRARSTWNPHKWLWPVLSFIWIVNIPAGLVYLYKRHQAEFLHTRSSGRIQTAVESIKERLGL